MDASHKKVKISDEVIVIDNEDKQIVQADQVKVKPGKGTAKVKATNANKESAPIQADEVGDRQESMRPAIVSVTKAVVLFVLIGIYLYAGVQRRADVKDFMIIECKKRNWRLLWVEIDICRSQEHEC